MWLYMIATVKSDLWKLARRHHNVGVAFIIAKQHIVFRRERLDQIIFQQQRFRFAAGNSGFDILDLRHHMRGARAHMLLYEIR